MNPGRTGSSCKIDPWKKTSIAVYEGALEGEMKQLCKVLDRAETRASMKADALDDLKAGRGETQKYQKAFGREQAVVFKRHRTKFARKRRIQSSSTRRTTESELNAAQVYDPSLVKDYEKVQARRRTTEESTAVSFGRGREQLPAPPSVDDWRSGYRLQERTGASVYG